MTTRNRHWGTVLIGLLVGAMQPMLALGGLQIEGFDSKVVEVRRGDKYSDMKVSKLGTLPIDVLDTDNNFLKIRLPGGEEVWVNRADVRTNDIKQTERRCQVAQIGGRSDTATLGARGIGEGCR